MASSRTILIAGAGIGGLTSALTLAGAGYRVLIAEQAAALGDAGAGIQLSPNATRILQTLGIAERLAPSAVVPEGLSIRSARSGAEIAFMPIGQAMAFRYGAPYWMLHRGDLQTALADAVAEHPDIVLKLATRVEDFAIHSNGVTAQLRDDRGISEERVPAMIGADGIWSAIRLQLGDRSKPIFRHRTAWRAMLPAAALPDEARRPVTRLWLGRNAHLVHYPVRGGRLVNIVAIVRDRWDAPGWSATAARDELLRHFSRERWAKAARDLLELPETWIKWALFDRSDLGFRGHGPVTLVGDAAHPMLPFLAQGAAMAIEDAAILGACLAQDSADPEQGMRRYESMRRARVRRVQQEARANSRVYHLAGLSAVARNVAMRSMGGERLRARYDWLYDWRPD
ncbi:FAD-dependent monooxygenase [Pseudorhodoplanes sp.]|uniref:FAD-dependent monooxygenase n=1 Tax=Pseudorhodoplanes sp. TaxID=1934341 RepID=UPI003D1245DD